MNYMKNPRIMAGVPVNMQFRGINDFNVRVDIIHYLKTLNYGNEKLQDTSTGRDGENFSTRWYRMLSDDREGYKVGGVRQEATVYEKQGRISK